MTESTALRPEPDAENGTDAQAGEPHVRTADAPASASAGPPGTETGAGTLTAPARPRRVLRAVARWTAAAVAFGLCGTGVAFGITETERGDLPGLTTRSDGRWNYPELELPPLPPGAHPPFSAENPGRIHHADIRDLLLQAPEGAAADEELPHIDGEWISEAEFAELYAKEDREAIEQRLIDDAVRHIAARGWAMPDGTRTSIYLLRFNSSAYPKPFLLERIATPIAPVTELRGAPNARFDESWEKVQRHLDGAVSVSSYDEPKPRGGRHVRQAYLEAGDTLAVIVQSRKDEAPKVPYQQTVLLQARLLG